MTTSKKYLVYTLFVLFCFIKPGKGQNSIVLNQNSYITISNGANLVIDNPNPNAIVTIGTGGNIISEGELNVVKWNIGTNTGSYTVPFTTNSLVKIPLTVNLTSAGTGASGAIIFSTYETATDSNTIYPSDVTNMSSSCTSDNSLFAIDRFWRIDAGTYTTKPTPVIDFGYDDAANELAGTNTIAESRLLAERFNPNTSSWETPLKLYGTDNPNLNTVNGVSISPADFYQSWTLIDTNSMYVSKTVNVVLCQGDSIFLQGQFQTGAGAYMDTINAIGACDTSVTTNLSFTPTTTVSNAGINHSVCGTTDTLAGNTAINGVGVWSLVSGTGTFTNSSSPTSEVTGLSYGANVFQWTINNGVCPSSTSTVTVTGVETPTVAVAGPNQLICNDSATLAGNTPIAGTGIWTLVSGTATIVNSSSPSSMITGLVTGSATLVWTITNAPCPASSDSIIIVNTGGPLVAITSQTNVACNADSTGAAAISVSNGVGSISYQWTGGAGTSASAANMSAGTYTITVTDSLGCIGSTSVTITEPQALSIVPSQTNISCYGSADGTASVAVSGGTTPYSYMWTPGASTSSNISGLTANSFTCTVTDSSGCEAIQTFTVTEPDSISAQISSISSCGANNGSATITNTTGGTGSYSYSWSPSGGSNATATGLSSGTYTCVITDANNCTLSKTTSVTSYPAPVVSLTPDTTLNYGTSANLLATGGAIYSWTPSTALSCTSCPAPVASPLETTTYCVVIADTNNCVDSACITININKECAIAIPTAFSPNNDGANDLACFHGHCSQTFHITLFDRWGEKVFETNDINQCWNGAFKGSILNSAVFVYYLESTLTDGSKVKQKGNITLIR